MFLLDNSVSVLLYHFALCASLVYNKVQKSNVMRYEIYFLELGAEKDHVYFLVKAISIVIQTKVVDG